jgi:HEPN domain-containing protein
VFGPDIPSVWLNYADRSYVAARLLWFTGLQLDAPVQAHRAIELLLKACLVANGVPVEPRTRAWGHDLGHLWAVCLETDAVTPSEEMNRRVKFFNDYFDYVRYPTSLEERTDGRAIWFAFDKNISPLDEVFAYLRPRIKAVLGQPSFLEDLMSIDGLAERVYLKRALTDSNDSLSVIIGIDQLEACDVFSSSFSADHPGC